MLIFFLKDQWPVIDILFRYIKNKTNVLYHINEERNSSEENIFVCLYRRVMGSEMMSTRVRTMAAGS